MKKITFEEVKNDIKHVISRCGIQLYVIQFILIMFNVYSTYNQYRIYSNKNVGTVSDWFTIIEVLVTIILTITAVTIIDKGYEAEAYNIRDIIVKSIKKLPRFAFGYLRIGAIILGVIIVYISILNLYASEFFIFISKIVIMILWIYILNRFCLAKYILVIEKDSGLFSRSKEFYNRDKSIMIKYFIITVLTGFIPMVLLVLLPSWLGIELSSTAFLVTRLIISVIGFVLTPLINIVGLSIYKYFIDSNIKIDDIV